MAAAGVSRRTFFRYFKSKEAAFFASHDDRLHAFVAQVRSRADDHGAWKAVCDALVDVAMGYEAQADRDVAVAWRRAMRSSTALVAYDLQMDADWEAEVAKAFVAEGDQPADAVVRAGAVMGVVRAVMIAWHEGDGSGDLVTMGRQALDWLASGMGAARV